MDPKFSQNDDRMWNNSCNTTYATQEYYKYFTDSIEILYEYLLLSQQMHTHTHI